jgi:hypothetical protein
MSHVLEQIKKEISTLRPVERFDLWRDLGAEFDRPLGAGDSEASVEAAWDAQIAARMKEVEESKVELISGEESDRRTARLFSELGIEHRPA